jgi:hypothetical protein
MVRQFLEPLIAAVCGGPSMGTSGTGNAPVSGSGCIQCSAKLCGDMLAVRPNLLPRLWIASPSRPQSREGLPGMMVAKRSMVGSGLCSLIRWG